MKTTKTQLAINYLTEYPHPLKNRGHAFVVLQEAGLTGSGAVFNKAVAAYEEKFQVRLGKSAAVRWEEEKKSNRAAAHQMSAAQVKDHIQKIKQADALFWSCWKVFRYEGKWSNSLSTGDFAVHFNK